MLKGVSVSVIVPAYRAEKTIGRCLEALLGQDYPKGSYEIIVVDDGSPDKTGDIIKSFPVKYLRQSNSGPATARNSGVGETKGEIILFTDSDCVPDRDWISEMIKPFEDLDIAAVKGAYRTEQREVAARFSQIEFEERFEMLKKAASIDMIDTYSAGFRKEVFLKMGGFDTSFPAANNEDTELSYRMSRAGFKMAFNPRAIVCHLNHPDSIKRYARLKFSRGYWRMIVYKSFPDKMMKDTYTPKSLKLEILLLLVFFVCLPFASFYPRYGVYALLALSFMFLILTLPFTLFALKRDPLIGPFIPALLLIRASSLGLGALWSVTYSKKNRKNKGLEGYMKSFSKLDKK
ncbi:MAG: glycosyltransferase [Deltaproteobacteria bacterium]|nr:glycosyltransferase [Deltaproteobacteria bacterium]